MRTKMMLLTVILATTLVSGGMTMQNAAAAEKKAKVQTICPVMGGAIDKKYFVDYKGERIYFCCGGCPETFKKNPEMYLKKMRESGVEPEKVQADGAKKKETGTQHKHTH